MLDAVPQSRIAIRATRPGVILSLSGPREGYGCDRAMGRTVPTAGIGGLLAAGEREEGQTAINSHLALFDTRLFPS
jgi:hypothetical protein